MNRTELAQTIDHTQLKAFASQTDIAELCDEAVRHTLHSVMVNPVWTRYCAKRLAGTDVKVGVTIGFPLGANTAHIKVEEAREAFRHGANELDMVINVGAIKSGAHDFVEREIKGIVEAAPDAIIKVILETSYLTDEEKVTVCEMAARAGAGFVKTSTGFGYAGATVEDVALMRQTVGEALGVKAAGGIRTYADAMAMIEAGATRLGTSSAIEILEEADTASGIS